ncbi:hypothetical protein [Bacillus cereus group sp. Bc253]|uniref:hypothetical protein n=1 Tax=Bacillus cereus group sp. Bc253 TaxID=3018103 RepID=UPI0022E8185B|nr:hypothetical protein [Bacillus cereus group sp. Bc253]MDA2157850.1 hypothetical protein [Bacillus cereus group sp. Bc253]
MSLLADGAPDYCFIKGKEYDMCLDERKNECFTLNDVEEMHLFGQKIISISMSTLK